ncbi:MAG: DNA repair protein RecO [Acidobacteria bacterium]|nr:DNA repair protein RecO [Acidobacteriota bacterium]
MAIFETEALVLKTYNLSDADKIAIFLTLKSGLIRGVAKGAKRLKSKFGGGLEPFSVVQLEYHQKEERELVSIQQIELIKSYFKIASNPEFLQTFSYLIDLVIQFAPPHEPNERLFKMVRACLESNTRSAKDLESIKFYFEYWMLRLGGYLPDWLRCSNCRRELEDAETVSLRIDFDVICQKCKFGSKNAIINADSRRLFNIAQKIPPDRFIEHSRDKGELLKAISEITTRIISRILDREVIGLKPFAAGNY